MHGNHKPDSFVVRRRKANEAHKVAFKAELDRMLIARAELFEELDRFPRNASAEAKRARMDRHILRLKKSI